jgi:DDE superfamily endonuclease/Helix-turn-helix of DDE superfamily endonuclease
MTHSERLLRLPATFRRLTGITPDAFRTLLAQLERAWLDARRRRGERPGRKRKPGAGHKHANALAERLLMLLIYYRTYVSHAFLGLLFSLDPGNVSRNIAALEPLLAGIFRIPERRVEVKEDEVRELFFDGTERPTRRPIRRQGRYYSGKKKRHTLKNQVVVVRKKKRPGRRKAGPPPQKRRQRIAAVSRTSPGRVHDRKVYDGARTLVPPGVRATGDLGYEGTALRTPAKKPRGGELTRRQRRGNRLLSRRRVAVEHGIGKMKIWRIAAERYRNPLRRHTLIIKNVAGLHNLVFA